MPSGGKGAQLEEQRQRRARDQTQSYSLGLLVPLAPESL